MSPRLLMCLQVLADTRRRSERGDVPGWVLITVIFFRRFMGNWEQQQDYRGASRARLAGSEGGERESQLTYEDVAKVFETVPPALEPGHDNPTER